MIRTRDLLNHLRCRRFSALASSHNINEINNRIVHRSDEDQTDDFVGEEIIFESGEEKTLDPISRLFEQTFLNKNDCSYQKNYVFERVFESETLQTTLPFFVKVDNQLSVFKVSSSTQTHFTNLNYSYNKKKYPLFEMKNGVYIPRKVFVREGDHTNYHDKVRRVLSRHYDTGRIVYDLAFSYFTLPDDIKALKPRFYYVALNPHYVLRAKTLEEADDLIDLFVIFDMTDFVDSLQDKIISDLYRMINLKELNDNSPCDLVDNECLKGKSFECPFVDTCFAHVPKENAITNYFYAHLGFKEGPHKNDIHHDTYELMNQGMVGLLDVPISWLHREKNLMQRYCVENDYVFINKKKVKLYLKNLKYPYYFLDFEAYPSPLPRFEGESPYSQSVFQFSLHKKTSENDPIKHYYYLSKDNDDHRKELLESLLQLIEDDGGSIIVYNQTFEISRLIEMKEFFVEYASQIDKILPRIFDLLLLLKNDREFFLNQGFTEEAAETYNFYHPEQSGSYSIKKILSVLGNHAYEDLAVRNGTMAYETYIQFSKMNNIERDIAYQHLLAYCAQDTFSMVFILDKIKSML
ncbi:MAG: DUF2779 domain-containing protein [Candidatus Izemoplasmatales bacterium]